MRFLVDTSVWSLALRRRHPSASPEIHKLRTLIEEGEDVCLLGVILAEVLQGIRDKSEFKKLKEALEPFRMIEPLREDYVFAAEIRNRCLAKGIQASTIDFLIASASIRHQAWLLTADHDFARISGVVPLRLA